MISCLIACQVPSEKGSTLKGKNLLPQEQILSFYCGSKFFPFIDPFQKDQNTFDRVTSPLKVYLFFLNIIDFFFFSILNRTHT